MTSWFRKLNASSRRWSMFASDETTRLSTQMTRCPRPSRSSQRCEPRKPAPPVTTEVGIRRMLAGLAGPGVEGEMEHEDHEQRGHESGEELYSATERADREEEVRVREVALEPVRHDVRRHDPEDRDQRVEDVADEEPVVAARGDEAAGDDDGSREREVARDGPRKQDRRDRRGAAGLELVDTRVLLHEPALERAPERLLVRLEHGVADRPDTEHGVAADGERRNGQQ